MAHVETNIESAEHGLANSLTDDQLAVYEHAGELLREKTKADCTRCRYCMPCAHGVDIPDVLAALNNASMWGDANAWLTGYSRIDGKAGMCTECGECTTMCPQQIPIPDLMKEAAETFGD